jgi:hypothetical protein
MKKKLLWAVGVSLFAAVPSSLWATPPAIRVQGPTYPPGAVETCTGGSIPAGSQVLTFTNTTSGAVTITNIQLPGVTTPTSIPPNGNVTFTIPPAVQGTYSYIVDGCPGQ